MVVYLLGVGVLLPLSIGHQSLGVGCGAGIRQVAGPSQANKYITFKIPFLQGMC